jgi:hypothetical protein
MYCMAEQLITTVAKELNVQNHHFTREMCIMKRYRTLAIVLLCVSAWNTREGRATAGQSAEKMILNQATIVTDAEQPSFVRFALEELADYLKESTGADIPIITSADNKKPMQILVGANTVRQAFPQDIPDEKLGDEGYLLKSVSKDGVQYVVAAGRTAQGTNLALAALMKAIQVEGKTAFAPASLNVLGKPAFANRGMHFNGWPLNYPYSFRSWREADWRRYLDILSCQGVNLFYLWPFIEIMPTPLSPEDQAYLEECRRVVDYAQKKHGMEVWIMQCTNRVAKDRCGVADPRVRPYWRPTQQDLNPGKPEDLKAILASREAMYRILDNADGVCNIDSDPGFCAGSPQSDYVKVLQACRTLLDRYNIHGKDAKLIHWVLWGWGRKEKMQIEGLADHQRLALRALKQGLPQPLWFLSGQFPEYLPTCRDEGLISRTLYFPYGAIEGEPAYPGTNVQIDVIRGTFSGPNAKMADLAGVMGNLQTPLLQFPNLFYFTSAMCDSGYLGRSEKDVLLDVSGHLYPDRKQLVADCYLALKEPDPAKIETLAGQLNDILQKDTLGRLGVFGRKLFPDHRIVAKSLYLQLKLRAAQERLVQGISPTTARPECVRLLCEYFDAYLTWDLAHGWHGLWGWQLWWPGTVGNPRLAQNLRKNLANDADLNACCDEVARTLAAKYDAAIVRQGCVGPLKEATLAAAPAAAKP